MKGIKLVDVDLSEASTETNSSIEPWLNYREDEE